jgi:acyl-CoA synthetase (AMP-forming)/AMP-acid ligase II
MLDRIRDRATADPTGVALVDDHSTMTWDDVITTLDALGQDLLTFATDPDERVAVVGENSIETLLAHTAAIARGVGTVAVSRQLKADEMADQLLDSGSVAIVTGPSGLVAARGAAQKVGLRAVIAHHTAAGADVTPWS